MSPKYPHYVKRRRWLITTGVLALPLVAGVALIANPPQQRWIEPEWTKQFQPYKITGPRIDEYRLGKSLTPHTLLSIRRSYQLNVPFEQADKALREELSATGWSKMPVSSNKIHAWFKRLPEEGGTVSLHQAGSGTVIIVNCSRSLTWPEKVKRFVRGLFGKQSGR